MPWWIKAVGFVVLLFALQVVLAVAFLGLDGSAVLGWVAGALVVCVVALFAVSLLFSILTGRR